jgi:hypothetical protein
MSGDGEIRELLGRAFGPEPPLALDREAVLRRGRRTVRLRRFVASGGVAASVLVVLIGAAVITGLPGHGPQEAAAPLSSTPVSVPVPTTSEVAPSGPQLPLTTATSVPEPVIEARAAALTKVLSTTMIPAAFTPVAVVDDGRAPLEFRYANGGYHLTADLRDAEGIGSLDLTINYSGPDRKVPTCADGSPAETACSVLQESNIRMRISAERHSSGYLSNAVYALRPDGTIVYVTSTNLTVRGVVGKPTSRPAPPLDAKLLQVIATLPGLTYY